jgi:Xaa-Pro aminopeptidase
MLKIDTDELRKGLSASATLTKKMFQWLVDQVEQVIDEDTEISHRALSSKFVDVIEERSKDIEQTYTIPISEIGLLGDPVVQSGSIDFTQETSDDAKLSYNVVALTIGAKVAGVPTKCVRTLLIDPIKT